MSPETLILSELSRSGCAFATYMNVYRACPWCEVPEAKAYRDAFRAFMGACRDLETALRVKDGETGGQR